MDSSIYKPIDKLKSMHDSLTGYLSPNDYLMLRSNVLFPLMPRRAPAVLSEMARRIDAALGCLFFWSLFFGQAKKSSSVVGPRTDFT
jgi:hypothetical protein